MDVQPVVDLLNSRAYAGMPDRLDDPDLAVQVLFPFGEISSAGQLEQVKAVRDDLVRIIESEDWSAFAERVSGVTFRQDFKPGRVELRQVTGDPLVGKITQAVAELAGAGNWSRLRLCANDICREVFYDTTRSRTRRWHSYEYCGNRANVASYRARHAGVNKTD